MNNILAVGIDCGLNSHQYHIGTKEKVIAKGKICNNKQDAKKLAKLTKDHSSDKQVVIGMEATNTYHLPLQKFMQKLGFEVIIINPIKTCAYNKIDNYGNKTDSIDANGICNFILDGKHKMCKQMNNKYLKLREMSRALLLLQADASKIRMRIHNRLAIVNPEYSQYFSSDNFCKSNLWLLEEYMIPSKIALLDEIELQKHLTYISNGFGKKETAKKIINLAKNSFGVKEDIDGYEYYIRLFLDLYKIYMDRIKQLKRDIEAESLKDYCKSEIDLIESIRGVSRILAAGIISEIGDVDNFEKKSSIVRFAGLIVLQKQSGNFRGKEKMSKQGSSYLRCYLYQAAMGARLHSPAFAAVFANRMNKLQDLGFDDKRIAKKKVMANLARRVLEAAYVCLKKDRRFNERTAFESLQLDDFIKELISSNFAQILSRCDTNN